MLSEQLAVGKSLRPKIRKNIVLSRVKKEVTQLTKLREEVRVFSSMVNMDYCTARERKQLREAKEQIEMLLKNIISESTLKQEILTFLMQKNKVFFYAILQEVFDPHLFENIPLNQESRLSILQKMETVRKWLHKAISSPELTPKAQQTLALLKEECDRRILEIRSVYKNELFVATLSLADEVAKALRAKTSDPAHSALKTPNERATYLAPLQEKMDSLLVVPSFAQLPEQAKEVFLDKKKNCEKIFQDISSKTKLHVALNQGKYELADASYATIGEELWNDPHAPLFDATIL